MKSDSADKSFLEASDDIALTLITMKLKTTQFETAVPEYMDVPD